MQEALAVTVGVLGVSLAVVIFADRVARTLRRI